MSLTASLHTALGGLGLNARRAEVLASNVANADAPGYAARRLSTDGTARGTRVLQEVDPVLRQMRRDASAKTAGAAITEEFATRLDAAMGDPDQPGSLQARLARLDSALTVAAADPTSEPGLEAVGHAAKELVRGIGGLADQVTRSRRAAETRIDATVRQVNEDLARVAELNVEIRRIEVLGQDAADLRDLRTTAVDRIAEAVPIRLLPREHGEVSLVSHDGVVLLDGSPTEIGFSARSFIEPHHVHPADLSGLTADGRPVGAGAPGDGLTGGTLSALFDLRDRAAPEAMSRLDAFAAELGTRFQDPVTDPSLAPGEAGLFTDGGGPVLPTAAAGLADRFAVNDRLERDGPTRLRDGFGAAAVPQPTSNANLLRQSTALAARTPPVAPALGTAPTDLIGLGARLRSALSSDRLAAVDAATVARVGSDHLTSLRDGGAVDVDAEMRRLLEVEQAYAANARLIQAIGQMMDRVTEL